MKYLLFKVLDKNIQYVIVSKERLYLLNDIEYARFSDAQRLETLNEFNNIEKEQISLLTTLKGETGVRFFDLKNGEILKLEFSSISMRKQFIDAFPNFKRKIDDSKPRMKPLTALILMLFTYSFIWAGTRPTSADINPEGIRWRLAYLNVRFLEWLNSLIGQKLILIIGITLILTLLYFIFRPELWNLFRQEVQYSNTTIIGAINKQ